MRSALELIPKYSKIIMGAEMITQSIPQHLLLCSCGVCVCVRACLDINAPNIVA